MCNTFPRFGKVKYGSNVDKFLTIRFASTTFRTLSLAICFCILEITEEAWCSKSDAHVHQHPG